MPFVWLGLGLLYLGGSSRDENRTLIPSEYIWIFWIFVFILILGVMK